jgi:putative oxidoreductase
MMSKNKSGNPLMQAYPDAGLLLLRLAGAFLLLYVHGLPKLFHYSSELQHIEDPFNMGANLTLSLAIFSEVLCPLLIAAGIFTRLACLPIVFLLLVAMVLVHPEWSIAEGQFGWLLLTIFASIAVAGPGRYSLQSMWQQNN